MNVKQWLSKSTELVFRLRASIESLARPLRCKGGSAATLIAHSSRIRRLLGSRVSRIRKEDATSGQFGIRPSDSKICQQRNETLKFVNSCEFVSYFDKSCQIILSYKVPKVMRHLKCYSGVKCKAWVWGRYARQYNQNVQNQALVVLLPTSYYSTLERINLKVLIWMELYLNVTT